MRIQITNCTIKEASGYGIVAGEGIDSFYNNSISVNGNAAMSMSFTELNRLDTSSILESGEGVGVELYGLYGGYIEETIELIKLKGNPAYLIKDDFRFDGGPERNGLVIEQGVEIRFTDNIMFEVHFRGYISANGTADEPIIFTGTNPSGPQWNGIFIESNDTRNKLEHCEIKYGGANAIKDSIQANIFLGRNYQLENGDLPSLILKNCIIGESGGCGVQVQEGAILTESNNTFVNNQSGDICD